MKLSSERGCSSKLNAYDDFELILEENKFDRINVIVICLITLCSFGAYALTHKDSGKQDEATTSQIKSGDNLKMEDKQMEESSAVRNVDTASPTSESGGNVQSSKSGATPSPAQNMGSYDPHKCDVLNNEATNLRSAADQKK